MKRMKTSICSNIIMKIDMIHNDNLLDEAKVQDTTIFNTVYILVIYIINRIIIIIKNNI